MPLPPIRRVVRDFLVADTTFVTGLPPARLVFKAPADVTTPFALIRVPLNSAISGDDVAWSPIVQIDGLCAESTADADDVAWAIVANALSVLAKARNVAYQNIRYSARLIDGPMSLPADVSRGASNPLARVVGRVELTIHNR